jgi:sulfoxide reductase heme-binding subunit YedZ
VFFYAALHFTVYVFLDRGLDFATVIEDVLDRKFITVGAPAFVILIALAITSPKAAVRRLGARRWQALHRAVYAAAILAATHFLWLRRGDDWMEPLLYFAAFALLFALRAAYKFGALSPRRVKPKRDN